MALTRREGSWAASPRGATGNARRLLASCALALAIVGLPASAPSAAQTAPDKATALFDATFRDLDWENQSLEKWRGRYLVVYFWASWCKPCKEEVPRLLDIYDEYPHDKLEVLGIAIDNADHVREFAKKFNIDYPVLLGGQKAIDLSKKLGNKIEGVPYTLVIDPQGEIKANLLGRIPEGKIEQIVESLLGPPTSGGSATREET